MSTFARRGVLAANPADVHPYPMDRLSSDRQKHGHGGDRQQLVGKAICDIYDWAYTEDQKISDQGVSAFHGDNFETEAEFGKFRQAAHEGRLLPNPVLLTENLDRISRECISKASLVFWDLVDCGVDVIVAEPPMHITKGDNNNLQIFCAVAAEFDRAHRESSRKQGFAAAHIAHLLAQAKEGKEVNFGWHLPPWIEFIPGPEPKGPGKFKLIPPMEAVIRRIIRQYLAGIGYHTIADGLNEEQIPPFCGGKMWYPGSISKLFRHKGLIGTLRTHRVEIADYLPRIVTDEEFKALRRTSGTRKARQPGAHECTNNLFPACAFCICGSACQVTGACEQNSYKGFAKPPHFFKCRNHGNKSCVVEGARRQLLRDAVELDFFTNQLRQFPRQLITEKDEKLQQRIAELQEQISGWDKKLETDKKLVGVMEDADLVELVKEHTDARAADRRELDRVVSASFAAKSTYKAFSKILDLLKISHSSTNLRQLHIGVKEVVFELEIEEVRKGLARLIPGIIGGIVMDIHGQRYAVKSLAGVQGPWIDLSGLIDELSPKFEYDESLVEQRAKAIRNGNNPKSRKSWWSAERRAQQSLRMQERRRAFKYPDNYKEMQRERSLRYWTPERRRAAAEKWVQRDSALKQQMIDKQKARWNPERRKQWANRAKERWNKKSPEEKAKYAERGRKMLTPYHAARVAARREASVDRKTGSSSKPRTL